MENKDTEILKTAQPIAAQDIAVINIIDEMQRSYLDYSMSVIVSRALPDVRDGLKPVHRRILYAMHSMGLVHNKAYRKSAGVVGEVMGKYHPHGDSSIYDALVRMAQDFSLRVPLIDGQGNYGSIDGDPPAAMRYTECRLEQISETLLLDINKDTVDFQENYDKREVEPTVLPARFPNLLVNGSGGIAVGMATNIPPHNLAEIINACIALLENPALTLDEVLQIVPGPDFPTGGIILGTASIRKAYATGRGAIVVRAKVEIEEVRQDRQALIVTEVPYQVNKAALIEKIAELVREKRIEGISDLRDESDREGYRVVIELKRDAHAETVLNQLYRYTQLQTSFGCNMLALNSGKPEQLSLLEMLKAFLAFREEVVTRRTKFLLKKARERAHALVGLAIAVANIDEVIRLIRQAPDPQEARQQLMERRWPAVDVASLIVLIADPRHVLFEDGTYCLSEEQARAILELRLQRLTALGREEIAQELNSISVEISDYLDILQSRERVIGLIKQEMIEVRNASTTPRRTKFGFDDSLMSEEDLIASEDMAITVSHAGYVKRVPLNVYKAQRRGGKGRSAMATKDSDFVTQLFVANTHANVLFFSSTGLVYKEKVWRLPLGTPQSRGKAFVNLLPLQQGERITSILVLDEGQQAEDLSLVFATPQGTVRRNKLSDFTQINRNGKIAMKFSEEGDEILSVAICREDDDIVLATAFGRGVRFSVKELRIFSSRNSYGVRGIRLAAGDKVISMAVLNGVQATAEERVAYLKRSIAERSALPADGAGGEEDIAQELEEEALEVTTLSDARYEQMKAKEQILLVVSSFGYGKRCSSYNFSCSHRGIKGYKIADTSKLKETGEVVALFPVLPDSEVLLVSDGGQLIRMGVQDIRQAGRTAKGVRIFRPHKEERVVSVECILEGDSTEEQETNEG